MKQEQEQEQEMKKLVLLSRKSCDTMAPCQVEAEPGRKFGYKIDNYFVVRQVFKLL